MLNVALTGLIMFFTVPASDGCSCLCVSATAGERTRYGGNEIIAYQKKETYEFVRGEVLDPNAEPMGDVLIEIFDQPEWIKEGLNKSQVTQKRIAACRTGKGGTFCFKGLSAGKYELRISKGIEWNPTHIYIEVDPNQKGAINESIEVWLALGT